MKNICERLFLIIDSTFSHFPKFIQKSSRSQKIERKLHFDMGVLLYICCIFKLLTILFIDVYYIHFLLIGKCFFILFFNMLCASLNFFVSLLVSLRFCVRRTLFDYKCVSVNKRDSVACVFFLIFVKYLWMASVKFWTVTLLNDDITFSIYILIISEGSTTQQTFSNVTVETLEKSMKYRQS